jgi:hypothetical protein
MASDVSSVGIVQQQNLGAMEKCVQYMALPPSACTAAGALGAGAIDRWLVLHPGTLWIIERAGCLRNSSMLLERSTCKD